MSNLPLIVGCSMMLAGILWFLWPSGRKTVASDASLHVQLEAMIAQTKNEKVKQHLRQAGKALYEVPDEST
jgi:hypothetical protein